MNDKRIIIIGGTSGSGKITADRFLANGYKVIVLGRKEPVELMRQSPDIQFCRVELKDLKELQKTLAAALVGKSVTHLAFFQRFRGNGDPWHSEIQVGLTATKEIIENCIGNFDGSLERSIVFVGSLAGRLIHDEQPVGYHVVKAALVQMARYYAVALGGKGIRVNVVSPSTIIKDESKNFYINNDQPRMFYESITPLHRMGTSEDIADLIEFLCSNKASFITGQEIMLDGGLSLISQTSQGSSTKFDSAY